MASADTAEGSDLAAHQMLVGSAEVFDETSRTVEVRGVNCDTCEDDLEDLFQDKCNEGDVERVNINRKTSSALVVFSSKLDAETMISTKEMIYEGSVLEFFKASTVLEETQEKSKTVQVTGVPPEYSDQKLKLLFSNEKRGGPITDMYRNKRTGAVIITFENQPDAEKVLETARFEREKNTFVVGAFVEVEEEVCLTLQINGLPDGTDDEMLELLLENHGLIDGSDAFTHMRISGNTAIVSFSDLAEVAKMLKIGSIQEDDSTMVFTKYEEESIPKRDIVVYNVPETYSEYHLKLFFQNKRKANGGPVSAIHIDKESNTAHITFESEIDAQNVVAQETFLRKDGITLRVDWHTEQPAEPDEQIIDPTIVKISKFTKKIDQDFLEDFLEDMTGVQIKSVDINRDKSAAYVKFETDEGPQNISLSNGQLVFDDMFLCVESSMPLSEQPVETVPEEPIVSEENRVVQISGLNMETINKEFISLFFENKEKSGGGEIEEMSCDETTGAIFIRFKFGSDATDVCKRSAEGKLLFSNTCMLATLRTGADIPQFNTCAIEVRGIPEDYGEEHLVDLFENDRYGGGKVEDLYTQDNRTVVTFVSPEDACRVLDVHKTKPISLEDQPLEITALRCPATALFPRDDEEATKIFVQNIPDSCDKADLVSFINAAGCKVKEVTYSTTIGEAIIDIDNRPEGDDPWEHVRLRPLKGQMLSVQYVTRSNSLEVTGVAELSAQKLQLFFESKRRSDGGEVAEIALEPKYDCAIVTFKKEEDAKRVLAKGEHRVEDKYLKVQQHFPCLAILPASHDKHTPPKRFPDDILFDKIDQPVLKYLMSAKKVQIENMFRDASASISWPDVGNTIKISCTLTTEQQNFHENVKQWSTNITGLCQKLLTDHVRKYIDCPKELVRNMKTFVSTIDEKRALIVFDEKKNVVAITGQNDIVDTWNDRIFKKIKEDIAHLQRQAERNQEIIQMEGWKIGYMRIAGHLSRLQQQFDHSSLRSTEDTLLLDGTSSDIILAKMEMLEIGNSLDKKAVPLTSANIKFLTQNNNLDSVIKACLDQNVLVYLFIAEPDLMICGRISSDIVAKTLNIIEDMITTTNLSLDHVTSRLLHGEAWRMLIQNLRKEYNDFHICQSQSPCQILITTWNQETDAITGNIKAFFEQQAIDQRDIKIEPGCMKLFLMHKERIEAIGKQCEVSIQMQKINDTYSVIHISGSRSRIRKGVSQVDALIKEVYHSKVTIDKPGMSQFFKEKDRGRSLLDSYESSYKVAIVPAKENAVIEFKRRTSGDIEANKHNVNIVLTRRNASELQTDSILISIQERFEHKHRVSWDIIEKGGESVKREISEAKKRKQAYVGCAFTTSAGDIHAKSLIHCMLPYWNQGKEGEEGLIHEAIYQGLKEAMQLRNTTVTIPILLATNTPEELQMNIITKCVNAFIERYHTQTTIREIYISVMDKKLWRLAKDIFNRELSLCVKASDLTSDVETSPVIFLPGPTPLSLQTPEGIHVQLIRGEIAKSKTDIIVNSTSRKMQLNSGAVSNSILKQAGHSIQKFCDDALKRKGITEVEFGEVFSSGSGKLSCTKVYHGALDRHTSSDKRPNKILEAFIINCLKEASADHLNSISFPALGTGNLNFPRNYVASKMLQLIGRFSREFPTSGLQQVNIVIYDEDLETYQVFCEEVKRCLQKSKEQGSVKPKKERKIKLLKASRTRSSKGSRIAYKGIKIEVAQGDLTMETVDVIAYSTDNKLSFGGFIGQAIKKKAGDTFLDECKRAKLRDGVAITGAGNLKCKKVLHIATPSSPEEWTTRVTTCLQIAEGQELKTIAFPALGTGIKVTSPSIMASKIAEGIEEFAKSPNRRHLSCIRLVIFDKKMVGQFQEELHNIASSPEKISRGWLQSFIDIFTGGSQQVDAQKLTDTDGRQTHLSSPDDDEDESDDIYLNQEELILTIFGLDVKSIDEAKFKIETTCNQECQERRFDSRQDSADISNLSDNQIKQILKIGKRYNVRVSIERNPNNVIVLYGRSESVSDAYVKVNNILRETEQLKIKEELAEKVQWKCLVDGQYVAYDKEINWIIEENYKNRIETIQFGEDIAEGSTHRFEIHFPTNLEYDLDSPGQHGRPIKRYAPGQIELPNNWKPMDKGKTYDVVELDGETDLVEYEQVLTIFKNAMESESGKYNKHISKIIHICRIQNPSLYKRYMVHKDEIEQVVSNNVVVERTLWHGTDIASIDEINGNGFNRVYGGKNAMIYGEGTYFAKFAGYSHGYAKINPENPTDQQRHMYLCKVLCGEYCKGQKGIKVPPPKDPKNPVVKYDSVVDNVDTPTMWIVFTDTQAYPEYLIVYEAE